MPRWVVRTLRWSGLALGAVWLLCVSVWLAHTFADAEGKVDIEHAALDVADLVRESALAPETVVDLLDDWADTLSIVQGPAVPAPAPAADDVSPYGDPAGGGWLPLVNPGYEVGYDDAERLPRWAAYRAVPAREPLAERPSRFRVDRRTQSQVRTEAFTRSGYDRGHLAPNRAVAAAAGTEGQLATFLLSNVVPQVHGLNSGLWRDLEHRIARRYVRRYGEVWVACGPAFDTESAARRIGPPESPVRVPDAFWMVVAERTDAGALRVLAFLVPHREIWRDPNPSAYLVSVDEVERLTGLDFFPTLPSRAQDALERAPAPRAW